MEEAGGVIELVTAKDRAGVFTGRRRLRAEALVLAARISRTICEAQGRVELLCGRCNDRSFLESASGPKLYKSRTPAILRSIRAGLSDRDRLGLVVRHGSRDLKYQMSSYSSGQPAARSRQSRNHGILSTSTSFAQRAGDLRLMVRDDSDSLSSNPFSTPIIAFQNRGFREEYFKARLCASRRHEWKAGVEADFTSIHERFSDVITDAAQFGPGTPQLPFLRRWARLGAIWIHPGFDSAEKLDGKHRAALGPLSIARKSECGEPTSRHRALFTAADLVLHASYDRVFQTPAFENILLSSSAAITRLIRMCCGSRSNFAWKLLRSGTDQGIRRTRKSRCQILPANAGNFADDDQLLNTGVSFPIAFRKSSIYGAEGKIEFRISGTSADS